LIRLPDESLRRRVAGGDEARRLIEALLREGRGLIVLTLHLGNWEMGLLHLASLGRPVSVVLRPEDSGGAPFEEEARRRAGVRVVERFVADYPTQWFNFYEVWGEAVKRGD